MNTVTSPLFDQLLALCDDHHWYRMNSALEIAASDLANPTYNPYEVYYTRERHVPDGVKEVETISKGKAVDPKTHKVRTDERTGVAFITKHRVVVEETYKTPQLHEQEFVTKISNFHPGQRGVRDLLGVRIEKVIPLEEPWPLGLTGLRTKKAVERIRSRPLFRPPQLPSLNQPSLLNPPPQPSAPNQNGKQNGSAPTAKVGKGMRRSPS